MKRRNASIGIWSSLPVSFTFTHQCAELIGLFRAVGGLKVRCNHFDLCRKTKSVLNAE